MKALTSETLASSGRSSPRALGAEPGLFLRCAFMKHTRMEKWCIAVRPRGRAVLLLRPSALAAALAAAWHTQSAQWRAAGQGSTLHHLRPAMSFNLSSSPSAPSFMHVISTCPCYHKSPLAPQCERRPVFVRIAGGQRHASILYQKPAPKTIHKPSLRGCKLRILRT